MSAKNLAERLKALGPSPAADAVLDDFLSAMAERGLTLYAAQEEALLELAGGKNVILNTPTGSGKSLVALFVHFKAMAEGKRSYYTCPIKALASEKFFALCRDFGAENVGMLTGDASINPLAPIICCTAEILANKALARHGASEIDEVVIDEFHYYADKERGTAWQVPLLTLGYSRFLLMSATFGDTDFFAEALSARTERPTAVVRSNERPVALEFSYRETPLHETISDLLAGKWAPIYVVNFTQRAAAEQAQNLMSLNFTSKEEKAAIAEALYEVRFDTPYGKEMQKFLKHGVGLHHAGLLPKYRLLVEKLAQRGMLKVISGTDTLGVGVNVPIRSVLFTQLCKFDGEKTGLLSVRDFQQISGRAGRKGFDDRGAVVVQAPEHVIENLRLEAKAAAGKKVVKKKPPDKGYVPWDRKTFERLTSAPPETLQGVFAVTSGMLMNVLQEDPAGYRRLIALIAESHTSPWQKRHLRAHAAALFRALRRAGILVVEGKNVVLHDELQGDFSLHHALALFLVETLPLLERAAADYPLNLLTLVESISENPTPILLKQLDKAKTERMAELKAQGVPFEERVAELDAMEHPKPLADFVYQTFNAFLERHPYMGAENIRPKSIARDMYERYASFNDYVREYGVARSEGVLLRYLSEIYKVLVQTVPEPFKDEGVGEIEGFFATMLRQVDRSLINEWERLSTGAVVEKSEAPRGVREVPAREAPAFDAKAIQKRVRSELHRLVVALARREYEDAEGYVRQDPPWTAARFAEALAGFYQEHAAIVATPEARRNDKTSFASTDTPVWKVTQIIVDAEGDNDWALSCEVHVEDAADQEQPMIRLVTIGV